MKAPVFLLATAVLLPGATFDFSLTGTTSGNNSQNGGAGNVNVLNASVAGISATIDGIGMTISAVSTSGAATLGANSQGIGVSTDSESGANETRIESDKGESIAFTFDATVTLDSIRCGNFASGESLVLTLVSGPNPFLSGNSFSLTGDGSQGPATDIALTGQIGPIDPATVLSLTFTGGTNDGLWNEVTVSEAGSSTGNLVTSIATEFPSTVLAGNPAPTSSGGSTKVATGNRKAQSFSLDAGANLTGVVLLVQDLIAPGDFSLQIQRAVDGLPWHPEPVFSDAGTLPAGLAAGDYLRIDFGEPVALQRGSHAMKLAGLGATDFDLMLSGDDSYPAGAGSRDNSSTNGWTSLATPGSDFVFAALGTKEKPAPPAPDGAPNLIFILADDYGWTDVRSGPTGPNVLNGTNYGSTFYETPNLARLAAEGLSFTHCFAHPNCAPTRAAILSGQYSCRSGNGVYAVTDLNRGSGPTDYRGPGQNEDIPAGHTIVAEALQNGGYVTAHIGKYHVGGHEGGLATMPENNGYDFNFGGDSNGNPGSNYHATEPLAFNGNVGPGLDSYSADYTREYIDSVLAPVANTNFPATLLANSINGQGANKHVEDAMGDAAIAFMNEVRKGELSHRPFYLQLHNFAVHTPIGNSQARADLLEKYQKTSNSDPRHDDDAYAAINEAIDQTVGRILNYLDDPDDDGDPSDSIAANTLIIFTSDNGGHVGPTDNDPLRYRKGSFYNGGLRVPLIVRQPGTIPAGIQSDTLVHSVDFFPTLVEHAGLMMPEDITYDGESFAAHMNNPSAAPRDRSPIFYHFPGYLDTRARPCDIVIKRVGNETYKLIHTDDLAYDGGPSSAEDVSEGLHPLADPWELYAFDTDLSESSDLINGSPSNTLLFQEIADGMAADLNAWLTQSSPGWEPSLLTRKLDGMGVPFPPASVAVASIPFENQLRITSSSLDPSSGVVSLTWNSELGFHYGIEASDNLLSWKPIADGIDAEGSLTDHSFTDSNLSPRFYRVVLYP